MGHYIDYSILLLLQVGTELAGQLGLMYFECSAKDFKDVENPFYYLANEWHKIHQEAAAQLGDS